MKKEFWHYMENTQENKNLQIQNEAIDPIIVLKSILTFIGLSMPLTIAIVGLIEKNQTGVWPNFFNLFKRAVFGDPVDNRAMKKWKENNKIINQVLANLPQNVITFPEVTPKDKEILNKFNIKTSSDSK